jgi:Ni,Fe-hydrogenase I cytochrome b subunit
MAIIEPVRQDIENPRLIKKYSSSLRLWHWLSALIITGSLLTVFLNKTLTNNRQNATLIQNSLQESKISVSYNDARHAAHEISENVWHLHTYFGYVLTALLAFRMIAEFFQLADQKLIRKIKSAYQHYFILKKDRKIARHEYFVKLLYVVFYLLLFIMVVTGFCLAYEDDVPALKAIHAIREVHEIGMYLIIAFIIVHLAGVFLAERKDSGGIVSDMINGGKAENRPY